MLDDYAAAPNGIDAAFRRRKHLPLRVRLWIDFLHPTMEMPAIGRRLAR